MNAYVDAMRRYFDFKSRSGRAEFWYFMLVVTGFGAVALATDLAIGNGHDAPLYVTAVWAIPHYIPMLSAAVRRLHDIDRTGWWVLIGVIPLGQIVLVVFYCQPSTPGVNRFGPRDIESGAHAVVAAHQQTKPTTGTPSLERLERLAALRASGAIDEAEFRQMKADAIAAGRA